MLKLKLRPSSFKPASSDSDSAAVGAAVGASPSMVTYCPSLYFCSNKRGRSQCSGPLLQIREGGMEMLDCLENQPITRQ